MLAVGFLYVFLCMLSFLFFLSIFLILNFVECAYSTSTDQFSSVTQSCPTLCIPMDCSMPSLPVCNQLPEFTQTHVHLVGDAIQPSHPLLSPFLPALSLSQHQGLFPVSQFFASGGQSIGISVSASVLPANIQY